MFKKPKISQAFEHENNFYLSSETSRITKLIAQFKLFELSSDVTGEIIEFGVFKGASFSRLLAFRDTLGQQQKKIIGFDTFEAFPETNLKVDSQKRKDFINESGEPISVDNLSELLTKKNLSNFELIKGDIVHSLPEYLSKDQDIKFSFVNLDVDIYEPSKVILENIYERVNPGGIIMLDDYKKFKGETDAVDEFFSTREEIVNDPIYDKTPFYIIKK